jgi:beta-1,3-galactosyl-O-glycosyl-glycoprotein beta-1,6-N-acetylglucosaminyltransferase/N-acetyllactosaminide beta-1,6-N-acetylglucosaminyltransferase
MVSSGKIALMWMVGACVLVTTTYVSVTKRSSFQAPSFAKVWKRTDNKHVQRTQAPVTTIPTETPLETTKDKIPKLPKIKIPKGVNCSDLFINIDSNTSTEAYKGLIGKVEIPSQEEQAEELITRTENCAQYIENQEYITSSLSQEEESFPLAFSILIYKDVIQVERLLRDIYRPQNLYCIHVDRKSNDFIHAAIHNIARCFPNVFVAQRCIKVDWGLWGVLEAEIICMKELLARSKSWRYFINLTGQEFPLRTNLEIVRILKALNGSNDVLEEDCGAQW